MTEATGTRKCRECGVRKPLDNFYTTSWSVNQCRDCKRQYSLDRVRRRSAFLSEYKVRVGCMDCGFRSEHAEVFDLDHRPGEEKLFEPSRLRTNGSMEQLLTEIAKCDVVCANCHRVRTKLRGDWSSGADWDLRRAAVAIEPDELQLAFDIA